MSIKQTQRNNLSSDGQWQTLQVRLIMQTLFAHHLSEALCQARSSGANTPCGSTAALSACSRARLAPYQASAARACRALG